MIENYLNNNHISADEINIKIVFSIMRGFGLDDTSPQDLNSYQNLCNRKYTKNAVSSYTVLEKGNLPGNQNCYLSGNNHKMQEKSWKAAHPVNKRDFNNRPELFDDFDVNPQVFICANCLKCYIMSPNINSEYVEAF